MPKGPRAVAATVTSLVPPPPLVAVAPILRGSLHDEVAARVRDMIVDGRLVPGAAIPELTLAAQLGVSRTPLREALKVLASEGLVELLPGRGAVVKVFTAKDAQDMLQVMATLEEMAGRAACAASDATLAPIFALHDKMREHYRRRERREYFALNQDIHNGIIEASGNATLVLVHKILRMRMRRLRYKGNDTKENWAAAMAEHDAIVEALRARDAQRTGLLLRRHLENTWPRILSLFSSLDQGI